MKITLLNNIILVKLLYRTCVKSWSGKVAFRVMMQSVRVSREGLERKSPKGVGMGGRGREGGVEEEDDEEEEDE